eukprot:6394314-Prymnesium_polylepis.1
MPSRDRAPLRPPRPARTRLGRRAAAARRLDACPFILRRFSGSRFADANECGAACGARSGGGGVAGVV